MASWSSGFGSGSDVLENELHPRGYRILDYIPRLPQQLSQQEQGRRLSRMRLPEQLNQPKQLRRQELPGRGRRTALPKK